MKRDLIFFISGLVFGIAAGYFVFEALSPVTAESTATSAAAAAPESAIGLEPEQRFQPIDEEAVEVLTARAEANPQDAATRAEMGSLYMNAGRFAEALPWLEQAVALDTQALDARNGLALTYLNLGRLDDAVGTFEGTLSIDPDHAVTLFGLGRVKLYMLQDIRGGMAMWDRLVEAHPDSLEASEVRAELEALKSAHSGS